MNIFYKKNQNEDLFSNFQNSEFLNMNNPQNYIPLYNNFFTLSENNFNSINLNNDKRIMEIIEKISENRYKVRLENLITCCIETIEVFFKLSPLIDPVKYLAGKYDVNDENLYRLPKINDDTIFPKMSDVNNCSYVDGFFSYLSGQLYNHHGFLNGIDFYGSFLGVKNNYVIDICDDIEFLDDKEFFYKNINNIFHFLNPEYENIINHNSRDNKKRLEFDDDETDLMNVEEMVIENISSPMQVDNISNIQDITQDITENIGKLNTRENVEDSMEDSIDDIVDGIIDDKTDIINHNNHNNDNNTELLFENLNENFKKRSKSNSSGSTCSSRSSITNEDDSSNSDNEDDDKDDKDDDKDDKDDEEESSSESSSDINEIYISINKFPIQVIALEKCHNTLDYLLVEDLVNEEELGCIVLQILMTLITYQKAFEFTHNDLHTNNIMYVETEKKYLYYKFNGKHYKIKTFGKIFKIIDFGRAIYKFKNHIMCSDSFHKDGDAATQYNFGPYYDNEKPLIEPNPSFDLCRLGCSMLDYIYEKYEDVDNIKSPIHKIIINWCVDDSGRNILYKNDGEERYPDFKLYKMIARKVHNHIPAIEINNKYFNKFVVGKKDINKNAKIFNIDSLEI